MRTDYYPENYSQMRAALVREIRDAQTWSDRLEALETLQTIRRDAANMEAEARHLAGADKDRCSGMQKPRVEPALRGGAAPPEPADEF